MVTRGIKNNNPFNIRRGDNNWLGKVPYSSSTDKEFEQFKTMRYGIRAGIILFKNYIKKGYDTPYRILRRFAPPSENDVVSYLKFLCYHKVFQDKRISTNSPDFFKLLRTIALYESNYDIPVSTLQEICFTYKIKL